jgi:sporulation protein YabP
LDDNLRINNNIIIENRKKFTLSGVKNVVSFDDETIALETTLGTLVIKGMGLHILSFIAETGDLSGEGKVNATVYTAEEKDGGFFSRIFK